MTRLSAIVILCLAGQISAFSPTHKAVISRQETKLGSQSKWSIENEGEEGCNTPFSCRRKALKSLAQFTTTTAAAAAMANISPAFAIDDDLTRGGVPLTPFNGLTFNYRGGTTNNGLDASTLNEPSIPYVDFLKRLDDGEVEFVEFLAPNGDAAYATFKSKEGGEQLKPIRIGEGYPIEDPEGWSSPAFVVKSVKKKGVPYKFTVPALSQYNK